jgi:lipopolysaccharide biosynthesis glycosyltransferase
MTIPIYVGYDAREAAVFTVFNQSVIQHSTLPVAFHPLHGKMLDGFDGQQDGTNAFIFSRYLVPLLQDYKGWAIFCDGDMILRADIKELWDLRDDQYAAMVVKHKYKTKHSRKYIGSPIEALNVDYPRKNWSSVILFNCEHPSNKILTEELVAEAGGRFLHTFSWLNDDEIGELPKEWNHLVGEYPENRHAKLVHWTHGAPGFIHYKDAEHAAEWNAHLLDALNIVGERPWEILHRAQWRDGCAYERIMGKPYGEEEPKMVAGAHWT